jgi:acyl dehydratase
MQTELFDRSEIYVGRDLGSYDYEITPALVQKYVEGTGDDNPWYRGASPLGGPIAPGLIMHSAAFRNLDWYPPNVYGNLHARQQWELFAPVMVGERLRARSMVVDRYLKREREYIVLEVLIADAAGRIAGRGRAHQSFIVSERKSEGYAIDKSRERDSGRVFHVGERGGDPIEAPMRKIDEAMCMAFSGPARNYHTDRQVARDLGFPEIVVQGMLSVCTAAEMMTRRFGLGFLAGGRLDLRMVNVLWVNEVVGPKGRIIERRPEGKRTRAEVEVWCEKADGTKTIVGTASALEL